jgi:hypothetical protein
MTNEVLGYLMAITVAVSMTTGARLFKTGELNNISNRMPFVILVLTILYGASTAAAFLYFSWAYLNWIQIVVFFVAAILLGNPLASAKSRSVV